MLKFTADTDEPALNASTVAFNESLSPVKLEDCLLQYL